MERSPVPPLTVKLSRRAMHHYEQHITRQPLYPVLNNTPLNVALFEVVRRNLLAGQYRHVFPEPIVNLSFLELFEPLEQVDIDCAFALIGHRVLAPIDLDREQERIVVHCHTQKTRKKIKSAKLSLSLSGAHAKRLSALVDDS